MRKFKNDFKKGKNLMKGTSPEDVGKKLIIGGLGLMIVGFFMMLFFGILLIIILILF